ncbi:MAG: CRISPR-associated helicase Cas3' [Methanobrevibacter sp.]|uniref:CRISPR-associated helicase Cas3' n=1 Tax=Methanobrevibacter sp. TaxID=66852 RepID=UPI003F0BC211
MVLLAKPDEYLMQHTENTLKVFSSIKNAYFEVPEICSVPNFWEHLFYSLFFHDFGKGASGFQNALKDGNYWNYRHEILSASFISSLDDIFSEEDIKSIGMCIITHHKDLNDLSRYDTYKNVNLESYIEKLDELKPNFDELIEYMELIPSLSKKYLGYELKIPKKITFNELINPFDNVIYDYEDDIDDGNYSRLQGIYGIFLKGFMNACDHLASGGQYEVLNGVSIANLLNFTNLRTTQEISSKTKGSAFLIAPTGSGKTEASLLWAENNQNDIYSKRLFYMLPYTASINAMYERLSQLLENENLVGLIHGKSSYFIYKLLTNDIEDVKKIKNLTKKIYRPYKILTPFQIIKYLFGVKGFEMGLSELTNSLIIIDEVHAYDSRTTCLLLESCKFLKENLNADIFIMSATLPTFLKNLFEEELSINNMIQLSNNELDTFTRHKVNVIENHIENYCDVILNDINDGKKVLIVCNTVDKSQKIFKWFREKNIENSALLHGKFILKDREEIERKLNDLDLLIGTQAIEVSLDIDYDVVYTEPAPFDALIQRFGRVNRRGWSENIVKPVNIFTYGSDNDKFIYNQEIVKKTLDKLKDVDLLKESIIQGILDDIYGDGFSDKDQETFDEVKDSFESVTTNLIPFKNSSNLSFYKLFNSIEVVPFKYCEEYFEKVDNKEFFEAMGYCLNITVGQFHKQNSLNNIEKIRDTFFISVPYDSSLGLLLSDEESTLL